MSFACPKGHHTLHIRPFAFDVNRHRCPHCRSALAAEVPPPPKGFVQFDHTFTPEEAWWFLSCISPGSYHWADIERIGNGRIREFTRLMKAGLWKNETLELGFYEHPIRWDERGEITHGVMRLIACRDSGRPFTAAVCCPEEFVHMLQVPPPTAILAPSGRPAQRS